eukprot:GHVT01098599.1.p1 GENE.GHVT01098599.1~~GHVT01098599.1.p1  ORF type:complete len:198 (-),score=58.90 GHVT01098599.1:409-1002(-)
MHAGKEEKVCERNRKRLAKEIKSAGVSCAVVDEAVAAAAGLKFFDYLNVLQAIGAEAHVILRRPDKRQERQLLQQRKKENMQEIFAAPSGAVDPFGSFCLLLKLQVLEVLGLDISLFPALPSLFDPLALLCASSRKFLASAAGPPLLEFFEALRGVRTAEAEGALAGAEGRKKVEAIAETLMKLRKGVEEVDEKREP